MLELIHVSKTYGGVADSEQISVLEDINLSVAEGESVSIVGPSGSGKSTLLNLIGTLDKATSGRVIFDRRDLSKLEDDELARIRNREIGFVFQLHHLLPQCTVLENVLIPTLAGRSASTDNQVEKRASELLKRVGLADRMNHRPGELSGGQRQRVAVVRALINKPKMLLADEPTGSLDRESAEGIGELLVQLNRSESVALIMVTHSIGLALCAERIIELKDGFLKERAGA
jgi:ABC-type lipoprotein export system ATPase subunit